MCEFGYGAWFCRVSDIPPTHNALDCRPANTSYDVWKAGLSMHYSKCHSDEPGVLSSSQAKKLAKVQRDIKQAARRDLRAKKLEKKGVEPTNVPVLASA